MLPLFFIAQILLANPSGTESIALDGVCACTPESQREGLLALKETTGIAFWDKTQGISEWEGVFVNGEGMVDSLILFRKEMNGELPPAFFEKVCCLKKLVLIPDVRSEFSLRGSIPPEIGALAELEYLDVRGNGLTLLPEEVGNLRQLRWLDISYNDFFELPESIGQLTELEFLNPSRNFRIRLPAALTELSQLRHLDLSENFYGEFPSVIWGLESLQTLLLDSNPIPAFPEAVSNLQHLEKLSARHAQISEFPTGIGQLSKLRVLNLASNEIPTIPSEIGQLTSLDTLDLSNNPLQALLPAEFDRLDSLSFLSLNGIGLPSLPLSILQFSRLSHLDLSGNGGVQPLLDAIDQLPNLKVLDLSDCGLKTLPPEIGTLRQLEELRVNLNLIDELPPETEGLQRLRSLDIGSNKLTTFPEALFQLNQLEELDFGLNAIAAIPEAIPRFKKLKVLILGSNQIDRIPSFIWTLEQLETLDLSRNNIAAAIPEDINKLSRLKRLILEENFIPALPKLDLPDLELLRIRRNYLSFDDIIPNLFYQAIEFSFSPQRNIPLDLFFLLSPCDTPAIKLPIDQDISGNTYEWFDQSGFLTKTIVNTLDLSMAHSDYLDYSGDYTVEVTNEAVPDLTLRLQEISVKTSSPCVERIAIREQLCPGESKTVNGVVFDQDAPEGCVLLERIECDTAIQISLDYYPADTLIEEPICQGERKLINNRWYGCHNLVGEERLVSPITGCDSTITVRLSCTLCRLNEQFIPEAITPNGDAQNETFIIPRLLNEPERFPNNELRIYNRFRQLVFNQKNYSNDWKGTDRVGRLLPVGTYYFVFRYDGGAPFSGTISIIY